MASTDSEPQEEISTAHETLILGKQRHRRRLAPDMRQKLLLENLSEVRHIAHRIHIRLPRHVPFDDLVHEGVVGLIDAVEKYDPAKNVQLRSYARFRIRGAILDSLRELDWVPRRLRQQARRIEQAHSELAVQLGREPSDQEVAVKLQVPLDDLLKILKQLHCLKVETLQALPEFVSDGEALPARRSCGRTDPFDLCAISEAKRVLTEAIKTLTSKEQKALTLYYFEEHTMKEIGRILSVQESRISQIICAALARLRSRMQNSLPACSPKKGG